MKIIDIPVEQLVEAPWNPNQADEVTRAKLDRSLQHFGLVQNLVVRPIGNNKYEVLSGNQRLKLLREDGYSSIPCCVVNLVDGQAKLLAQTLNRLHGQDDLALKAEVVRDMLRTLPAEEIMAILPDSKLDLSGLVNLGQESLAACLQQWEQARSQRLRILQFRLTQEQLDLILKALNKFTSAAYRLEGNNPNIRSKALYLLCQQVLKGERDD